MQSVILSYILNRLSKIENILANNSIEYEWLDLKTAEKYASISKTSLNRLINKGILRSSKVTGKTLIKKEWIDRFLEGK